MNINSDAESPTHPYDESHIESMINQFPLIDKLLQDTKKNSHTSRCNTNNRFI